MIIVHHTSCTFPRSKRYENVLQRRVHPRALCFPASFFEPLGLCRKIAGALSHTQKRKNVYSALQNIPYIPRFKIFNIFRVLEYSVYSVLQNIPCVPPFRSCVPPFHSFVPPFHCIESTLANPTPGAFLQKRFFGSRDFQIPSTTIILGVTTFVKE